MGLLNKLKNVLFEEEEIEENFVEEQQDNNVKIPKVTMELPKINKDTAKKENPIMSYDVEEEADRELFQAERTFDFPAFDEDEFDDFSTISKEEPKKDNNFENYDSKSVIPKKKEYTSTRVVKTTAEEEPKKLFRPSPVISPVYGILDKNYKKEDVLTKEEVNDQKNVKLDVDSVRKKAFGTLEEDLAATLTEPIEKFYEEPLNENNELEVTKQKQIIDEGTVPIEDAIDEIVTEDVEETSIEENLDELLDKTVDIEIDVTKEMELPSRLNKENYINDQAENSLETPEIEEDEIIPEVSEMEEEKEDISDDTLENDLFELIDSMYENGDDEE